MLVILKKGGLKTNYAVEDLAKSKVDKNYDSEDPEEYKEMEMFNSIVTPVPMSARKTSIKPIKAKANPIELEKKYQIGTTLCFIKISSFKKQVIGNTLNAILNMMEVELLGIKVVDAKKQIYFDNVPKEVRHTFKSVAYKFHEDSKEFKLRKQISELKCIVLVLRGQDVEGQIDSVYDREKLRFRQE